MKLALYGVAALQLVLVRAVQPVAPWNSTRTASAAEGLLHRASQAVRQRVSVKHAKMHSRRLQTAGSGPCTWQGGECAINDVYQQDLIMSLPAGSATRSYFDTWQVCGPKSMAECASSTECYWVVGDAECAPLNAVEPNVNDWFNYNGCGILEIVQIEAQCQGASTCASIADCISFTTLGIGSNGMCEGQSGCRYIGNMFSSACGSSFNIEAAMFSCASGFTSAPTEADGPTIASCIADACPSQADYWHAFFPLMFRCEDLTTVACGTTAGCVWEDGACGPSAAVVMRDAIPADCAARDFFLGFFDCEARPAATCESTECTYEPDATCAMSGVAPATTYSCSPRPERMFASLETATCDSAEAQAYTRGVLVDMECAMATSDSACSAVTDASSACRQTSRATGTIPLSASVWSAMLILLSQRLREVF
mmetsp:Transcript_34199/g.62559  ORF Transcript_34199/g.62559 Transcript_34199/m.62559 type:complete len:426 (-) Transcript_34199:131-1408(-)